MPISDIVNHMGVGNILRLIFQIINAEYVTVSAIIHIFRLLKGRIPARVLRGVISLLKRNTRRGRFTCDDNDPHRAIAVELGFVEDSFTMSRQNAVSSFNEIETYSTQELTSIIVRVLLDYLPPAVLN
jgi:hypothetical protein